MFRRLGKRPAMAWAIGLTMGLLIGAGAFFGTWAAFSSRQQPDVVFPELPLHATASHGESSLTLATGDIDGEAEGLFVLDHLTGDLQCFVVNTRRVPWSFSGYYTANVLGDLKVAADKTPKFVMVTGAYQFGAARGTARPAGSLVYVADANSGNVVVYSLMWNSSMLASGAPQKGALTPILIASGRNAAIRPGGDIGGPGVGQP